MQLEVSQSRYHGYGRITWKVSSRGHGALALPWLALTRIPKGASRMLMRVVHRFHFRILYVTERYRTTLQLLRIASFNAHHRSFIAPAVEWPLLMPL